MSVEVSSIDSKTNQDIQQDISLEHKDENQLNSPKNSEQTDTNSRSSSPKIIRSQSHSSKVLERNQSPIIIARTVSETSLPSTTRHLPVKQEKSTIANKQRIRSNSPRKNFSYLPPDRLNLRKWKQQRRQLAKQQEEDRIHYENRQKLERLAKIAKEPSSYPSIYVEQERQREWHAAARRREVLKSFLPILRDNLFIVHRLAHVKGVYDIKKMNEDFARHTHILKQDAANRKIARKVAAQRPFILPKIKAKS